MIDYSNILTIIPPIVTSILTWIVASKKSRVSYLKLITDVQVKALDVVSKSEEKMREEIRKDLELVKKENEQLRNEIDDLKKQIEKRTILISDLEKEITSLKATIAIYEKQISILSKISNIHNCCEKDVSKE